MVRKALLFTSLAAGALLLMAGEASAGGALQWAQAADQITVEGGGVGYALTGLAIIMVGIVLALSYHSLLTMALSLVVGGGLAANYDPIRGALFPGGAAGGSIYDVAPALGDLPIRLQLK